MNKIKAISIIPLMLLGAFLVPSIAHATLTRVGVVSVNGGSLVGVPAGTATVSVPIQISGSNYTNGFDILVSADPTILKATGFDLTGSVMLLPGFLTVIQKECINGIFITGNATTGCAPQDGPGVAHFVVTIKGGFTTNPISGTLFSINYNIVGSSANTPIVFTSGCMGTSITNGDCVTITNGDPKAVTNGSPAVIPETEQGATFSNLIDFTAIPVFPKLSTTSGTPITDDINYASEGGFSDILTETVTATAGLTATLASGSPGLVDLSNPPATGTDTLSVTGTASGSATVSACGTNTFKTTCHSVTIPVLISPPGFSIALTKSSVSISRGNSDSSTMIKVSSFSSFSSSISFSSSLSPPSSALITGTAAPTTPTSDASGYGKASPTLTIAVDSSVPAGTYSLTITGTSGSSSSMATISVSVPSQDFSIAAVPAAISIVRGGSVAADLNIASLGNVAGTVTFTTSITNQGTDSCCFTNNITPAYAPGSQPLAAGATVSVAFFASSVGGSAPASSYTATGNYTATITATLTSPSLNGSPGMVSHMVVIVFNIEDFSVGPSYCNDFAFAGTHVFDNTFNANQYGIFTTTPCNSITITDQPNIPGPDSLGPQTFWVQSNALGGLITDGFNGTPAIAALNSELPDGRGGTRGVIVPQLAATIPPDEPSRMCLLPTFFANGTQVPYSYLATHGPLITPGLGLYLALAEGGSVPPGFSNWGCKFDAAVFPNDHGVGEINDFLMTHFNRRHTHTLCEIFGPDFFFPGDPGCPYPTFNNPDFFGVTAMSIVGTQPGAYTFKLCAQGGVLTHCATFGLNVVASAIVHQLVVKKTISFSASGGTLPFKIGVTNPYTQTVYAQVTVTGFGSFGTDMFTVTSPVLTIAPNANVNNIALTVTLPNALGESFNFSFTIAESLDPNNLDGTSNGQSIQQTFTITA